MNALRSQYIYQVGHFVAGQPENLTKVDEEFLRGLESKAGIPEQHVIKWRRRVYQEFLDGCTFMLDSRMGYLLSDLGQLT